MEGGQFQELLVEVASELRGTTKQVEGALRRMEELAREHGDMRERLAKLEKGNELDVLHGDQEHGRLRKRLEDGDLEFRTLRKQAEDAKKAADSAKHSLEEIKKELAKTQKPGEKPTGLRGWQKKIVEKAVDAIVPLLVTGAIWFLYHLWVAAKLAEATLKKGVNP